MKLLKSAATCFVQKSNDIMKILIILAMYSYYITNEALWILWII